MSTSAELHPRDTNTADRARLDISYYHILATGLLDKNDKTFMDVRINHLNAPSIESKPVDQLLFKNEAEKNTKY